ncbi:MAG TPA: hypothetical protein VHZ03_17105 [Trebonia sp.]|jgi:hypothetical protein|nr:hypothetical protein [Trebonia sp.]
MGTLAELIDRFRAEVGYPGSIRSRRDAERAGLAPALSRSGLDDPDVRLLRQLAGRAYGLPGAQPGYYVLLQTGAGVAAVAATFRYLLYGPGEVEGRLEDCIHGEHKLPRVAEAMMVKALAVADPGRWFPNHVTTGEVGKLAVLELLGEQLPTGLTAAAAAAASNDRIRQLLDAHFPGDPWGIQEFTWWLTHQEPALLPVPAPDAADAYTPPPRGGEVPKSLVFETDPDKVDRGTTAHKDTQDALAGALRDIGLKPRSPKPGDPAFDIAWRDDDAEGMAFICEVKSLTGENETGQIRLAIGQVLDYVHTLDSLRRARSLPPHWKGVHTVRGVVAVERRPEQDVRWTALCEEHGIILTWPEKYAGTLAALAPVGLCDTEFELSVILVLVGALRPSSPPGGR